MDTNLKVMLTQLKSNKKLAKFILTNKEVEGVVLSFDSKFIYLNQGKIDICDLKNIKKLN